MGEAVEVLQITGRVEGEGARRAGWGSAVVGILRVVNGRERVGRAAMRAGMANRRRERTLGFIVVSELVFSRGDGEHAGIIYIIRGDKFTRELIALTSHT